MSKVTVLFSSSYILFWIIIRVTSDWVEIPQFSSKRILTNRVFLVTPGSPSIYDYENNNEGYSSFTTNAPQDETYNSLLKSTIVHNSMFTEPKKSITKIPDALISKFAKQQLLSQLATEASRVLNKKKQIPTTSSSNTNIHNKKVNKTTVVQQTRQKQKPKPAIINRKIGATKLTDKRTENSGNSNKEDSLIYKEQVEYYDDEEYEDDEYEDESEASDSLDGEESTDEYYDDYEDDKKKETSDDSGFSYSGFLPYLKSIQSTLIRTSHTNTKSKVSLLSNLRDTILSTIKSKIQSLFGPIRSREKRATARGDHYEKDDHQVEFPSNESSLLTIGFLTFAVFLIKMVLKLIHAIKNKESAQVMMIVPARRGKRSEPTSEEMQILNILEGFKNKYK